MQRKMIAIIVFLLLSPLAFAGNYQLKMFGPKGHSVTVTPAMSGKKLVLQVPLTQQLITMIHQKKNAAMFKPPYHKMESFFKDHVMVCQPTRCIKPEQVLVYMVNGQYMLMAIAPY